MWAFDLRAPNPKVDPVRRGWRVYGDSDSGAPTLSSAAPGRLCMHGATTSTFALTEVLAAREPTEPPPPLERWSARLVHGVQPADQRFRVRASVRSRRLSGLFLGTCSPFAYAALCRLASRTLSLRCGFAVESSGEVMVRRAAQCMPYALALLNVSRRPFESRPSDLRVRICVPSPIGNRGSRRVAIRTVG